MTFRVGQKVVCIVHWPEHKRRPVANYAEKGRIYTVRGHVDGTDGAERILLEEILNEPMLCRLGWMEFGFNAKFFRPIVERKTDISFAHEILRKHSRKVTA